MKHVDMNPTNQEKPFEFQVGDVCSFGGNVGTIEEYIGDMLKLKYKEGGYDSFTKDGRFYREHTEPLLKFISRPSKKIKKNVELKRHLVAMPDGDMYLTRWRMNFILLDGEKIIKTETKIVEYDTEE